MRSGDGGAGLSSSDMDSGGAELEAPWSRMFRTVDSVRCMSGLVGVGCDVAFMGGRKMGTVVGKPTFGGTSGIVAMIALALALVSFSVLLSDLTVCRDTGVASITTR